MKEINTLTNREAMGLPDYFKTSFFDNVRNLIDVFRIKPVHELTNIISQKKSCLSERWCAGIILSLIGDPRINPFDPEMITIPAGVTLIGSDLDKITAIYTRYRHIGIKKEWLMKEYPQHKVPIKKFKIAKYPVTNFEYRCFIEATKWKDIPSSWPFGIYPIFKANHPVYGILPESADGYIHWLNEITQRHFKLPTEYEWEYAAAGRQRTEFPWGNDFYKEHTNTVESAIYTTTPVGLYPNGASEFGCLDMAGNVEEYVEDNYFVYPDGEIISDDLGTVNTYRIARGGSFTRHSDLARCSRRHGYYKKDIYAIGFRLSEVIN